MHHVKEFKQIEVCYVKITDKKSNTKRAKNLMSNSKRHYTKKKISVTFVRVKQKFLTKNIVSTHPSISHHNMKTEVHTNRGKGIKLTPITHHLNKYIPERLRNIHLLKHFLNNEKVNPNKEGKTSTLSNGSFFISNENIESEDPEERIELNEKNGLINRIEEENMKDHYNHHLKNTNTFTDLIDETPVIDLDENYVVVEVEKDTTNNCFNLIIETIDEVI